MSKPTTTPSAHLRIHQPPDGPTPSAPVKVPAPVSTPAEIAAAIGAKASRYATTPSPCKGCGRPCMGSFGPQGLDGPYWCNVCQSCKDEADRELRVQATHGAMVASLIHKAATEPVLHNKGTDRLLSAIEKAEPDGSEQPERFDEMTGPMPDESGAAGGYGFSEKSPRYQAALGCGQWVVRDNRPGPQDPWEIAVGLGEDEARVMARTLNERESVGSAPTIPVPPFGGICLSDSDRWWINRLGDLGLIVDATGGPESLIVQAKIGHVLTDVGTCEPDRVPDLLAALGGLRDIIRDYLTYKEQQSNNSAIRAADVLLAVVKGGGK